MPRFRPCSNADPHPNTRMAERRRLLVALPAIGLALPALAGAAAGKGPPPPQAEEGAAGYSETEHVKAYYARARF